MIKQAAVARAVGVHRSTALRWVRGGMPLDSMEEALAWVSANRGGCGSRAELASLHVGDTWPPSAGDGDGVERADVHGTLARLREVELATWRDLDIALKADGATPTERAARMRAYEQAALMRMRVEKEARDVLVRAGVLIEMASARRLVSENVGALKVLLRPFASQWAGECNPLQPEVAKVTLDRAVREVFAELDRRFSGDSGG